MIITLVHPYLHAPESLALPWTVFTNCREALQGREQTSILLAKHSPRRNFILGFPHKLIRSSTITRAPHDKRLTKHRPVSVQHLSLHSPQRASHCSHSCRESTGDKCLHTPTPGEPCTAWTNTERVLNNLVPSHSIARPIQWAFTQKLHLCLCEGELGAAQPSGQLSSNARSCQPNPYPLHPHPLWPLQ